MGNAYFMFFALLFLSGVFAVEVTTEKKPENTEGDTVILNCCAKIGTDDVLEWKFESHVIATIKANKPLFHNTEIFNDRLQINEQTGELTIRNTRTKHSGLYEVTVTNNQQQTTSKRFIVSIIDPMPKEVSVTEGEPATLQHDIADIQDYDVIEWKFEDGKNPIAKIDKQKSGDPSYNRDRLKMDKSTGFLTITDAETTDSGLYRLQVTGTNVNMKNRKFRVVISESGPSTGLIVGIVLGIVGIVGVFSVAVWHKIKRNKSVV